MSQSGKFSARKNAYDKIAQLRRMYPDLAKMSIETLRSYAIYCRIYKDAVGVRYIDPRGDG